MLVFSVFSSKHSISLNNITHSVNIITAILKINCRLGKIGNTNDTRIIYNQPASKWPARGQEVNSVLAGPHPADAMRSTASRLVPTQPVPAFPSDLRSLAMRLVGGMGREIFSPKVMGATARWVAAGSLFTSGHQLGGYQPSRCWSPSLLLVAGWLAGWLYSLHYRPPTQLV